jgi:hypothetical protein
LAKIKEKEANKEFGDASAYPAATFLDTEVMSSWLDES